MLVRTSSSTLRANKRPISSSDSFPSLPFSSLPSFDIDAFLKDPFQRGVRFIFFDLNLIILTVSNQVIHYFRINITCAVWNQSTLSEKRTKIIDLLIQ